MKTDRQGNREISSDLPYEKEGFSHKMKQAIRDYISSKEHINHPQLANIQHTIIDNKGCKSVRIEFKDSIIDISEYFLPITLAAIEIIGKKPSEITRTELFRCS